MDARQEAAAGWWWAHGAFVVAVGIAIALRIVLVFEGGQYFWIDESHRFHPCIVFIGEILNGRWGSAADVIAIRPGHTGFFLTGIPIAAAYHAITGYSGYENLWVPSLMLSFASVAAIILTYLVARKAGAGPTESLIAGLLMACANSMFYYSRHILPYDTALAFELLAVWLALDDRPSLIRAALFGLVANVAGLTYYGYITSVLIVGVFFVARSRDLRDLAKRIAGAALGFALIPIGLQVLSIARGQMPFFEGFGRFVILASQGDYAEGWRLPWAYLWHAEHGLLVVWALGALAAVALWIRARRRSVGEAERDIARRGAAWVAIALGIYALLCLNSTVLERSVVLGRFARQLVPYLCLATAAAAVQLVRDRRAGWIALAGVAVLVIAQAAYNLSVPIRQRFPIEIDRRVAFALGANVARDISILGPEEFTEWWLDVDRPARYVLLNTATFLYPIRGAKEPTARGRVVFSEPHPLQWKPYQYELFTPSEREILRTTDVSMRLVDTADTTGLHTADVAPAQ